MKVTAQKLTYYNGRIIQAGETYLVQPEDRVAVAQTLGLDVEADTPTKPTPKKPTPKATKEVAPAPAPDASTKTQE